LIFLIHIVVSLPLAVIKWSVVPVLFASSLPVLTSALVAFKYVCPLKRPILFVEMSVLLMIYGFSRAVSLMQFGGIGK
jgi:hypothetical protein